MSVEENNKAIVRRFYEEVFNHGREEVIDEIICNSLGQFQGRRLTL